MSSRVAVVVAVGGNALIVGPGKESIRDQAAAAITTCRYVPDIVEQAGLWCLPTATDRRWDSSCAGPASPKGWFPKCRSTTPTPTRRVRVQAQQPVLHARIIQRTRLLLASGGA